LAKLKNSIAKIIYVTAQTEERTIQKAIETTPETYLTKPIKKTDLLAAVKLASFKKSNQFIIIKDGHNEVKIELDTILYIKSENIYIDIFTKIKKYTIRKTLDSFLKELNHPHFCKTHRSYIVNKTLITKISSKFVYLNDIAIPLSKTYNIKY
jgi:DNA-binding LytR/AlgR family response regulator